MQTTTPELIGIIVSGVVAGFALIIVFVMVVVYCYRAIDSSDDRRLHKTQRQVYYSDNGPLVPDPLFYGDSVSSVGTTAHLVSPHHLPVVFGPGVQYPEFSDTTLEKTKRKKGRPRSMRTDEPILGYQDANMRNPAFVNRLQPNDRTSKYSEKERHMEFGEEHRDSGEEFVRGVNPVTTYTPTAQPTDDEPVIVTYLEEATSRSQETQVKSVQTNNLSDTQGPATHAPPAEGTALTQATTDPDDGEPKRSVTSADDCTEVYHKRQREPPKGDINPPVTYVTADGDGSVLY